MAMSAFIFIKTSRLLRAINVHGKWWPVFIRRML